MPAFLRSRKILAALICLLSLASLALLESCGQGSVRGGDRLRVALLVSEGEELKGLAASYRNVAELVRADVARAGGVKRPSGVVALDLALYPHGEDVESALRALREAASSGSHVVIGGPVSRQALPLAALAEELRVPFISPGATHPDLVGARAHVFRTPYSDIFQAKALARLCRDEGAATAGVFFNRTDVYASNLADAFARAFRALGGRVVAEESYAVRSADLALAMRPLAQARPDVLFLPGYHVEIPDQARTVRALGYRGGIVGSDSWDLLDGEPPAELVGARYLVPWRSGAPMSELSRAFMERYTAAFGRQPTSVDALVYDAFGLVLVAAAAAKTLDAQSMRGELARVGEFQGVAGRALFKAGTPERDALVMEVSSRGVQYVATITPEAVAGR